MAGNTFGKLFTLTTFGESHGEALGGIIDGCPPGLPLSEADIQTELDRRRPGASHFTSQRQEADRVRILGGIFEGETTGAPIGLFIENRDHKSKDYEKIKHLFRPGHGDYTYFHKYGIRDYRGAGRASARETAIRVAGGAIAKKYLKDTLGLTIQACLVQMGSICAQVVDWAEVGNNPFYFPDASKVDALGDFIEQLRRQGDSIGARVHVIATKVPIGLGEPVFDKLDGDIAKAMMSINAVKGVEIGAGFDAVMQKGSQHRDEISPQGFLSNHAGGILAGISSGQDIIVNLALKPASSIRLPGKTVDVQGEPVEVVTMGRHDPCLGIRAIPIAEAMLALVLMDHYLRNKGQCK